MTVAAVLVAFGVGRALVSTQDLRERVIRLHCFRSVQPALIGRLLGFDFS